jgi:HEPN domain-containing protein
LAEPSSIDEWLRLAEQHEEMARLAAESRLSAAQALFHVGSATECALKALIMQRERLNNWPARDMRPELWTHSLWRLIRIAGVELDPNDEGAASWHVVLNWDRNQAYDPKPMPRKVARQWVAAAFDEEGVVTWIRRILA